MDTGNYEVGCSLDCPVCYEQYNNRERLPKMMSCLHTTCLSCILNMIEAQTPGASARPPRPPPTPSTPVTAATPTQVADEREQARRTLAQLLQSITSVSLASNADGTTRSSIPNESTSMPAFERFRQRTTSSLPQRIPILRPKPSASAPAPPVPAPVPAVTLELPKDTTFSCPMCRIGISTNNVQTNRYIIAHIEDINKLKKLSTKQNLTVQNTPNTPPRTSSQTFVTVDESWCVTCCGPADVNLCTRHAKVPLAEGIRTQSAKLKERAQQMEKNVDTQGENMRTLEGELRTILSTTRILLGKVESQNKEWKRIKGRLEQVKNGLSTNTRPSFGPPTGVRKRNDDTRGRAESAQKVQEMARQLEIISLDAIKIENAGVADKDCFLWCSDNRLYMKNGSRTYAVAREDGTYAV